MELALFGKKNKEINKVVLLPMARVVRNPLQPRRVFDEEALKALAQSIDKNGLLQPITVRRMPGDKYELIAGERRKMAYQLLNREFIPGIVEDYGDQQSALLALIENLQRKDLNYFEEAYGIQRLMERANITQQQVSERLGKAQSTVANKLRLLRFSEPLQNRIVEAGLSERHARALLRLPDETAVEIAVAHIEEHGLNVKQTEEYVDSLLHREKEPKSGSSRMVVIKDIRLFLNSINKAVNVMNQAGIPAKTLKNETNEFLEYTIRVPKASVYAKKESVGAKGLRKLAKSHS